MWSRRITKSAFSDAAAPYSNFARVFFILIDGLGDASCPQLDGRTPLQAASTPTLDALAAEGVTGLYDPFAPGIACGSDTAHLSIFGYPPNTFPLARGPLECLGAGLQITPDEIGFKSVFSTLASHRRGEPSPIIACRRADSNFVREGEELCRDLNQHLVVPGFPELSVRFKYAVEHRCGVAIGSTRPLSHHVTGTDPLSDGLALARSAPRPGWESDPSAVYTAAAINAVSDAVREFLADHPVNQERRACGLPPGDVVLFRAPGKRTHCPSLHDHHGIHTTLVAGTAVIRGLGGCIGASVVHNVPGAAGDYTTDFAAKAAAATDILLSADGLGGAAGVGVVAEHRAAVTAGTMQPDRAIGPLPERCDMMFLHLKAVDEASHDRDPVRKAAILEDIDSALGTAVARLRSYYGRKGVLFVLTGDHSTPCHHGDHGPAPVPLLMAGAGIAPDPVVRFDELSCARGALGRFRGADIMPAIKALAVPGRGSALTSALLSPVRAPPEPLARASPHPLAAGLPSPEKEIKSKVAPSVLRM